MWAGCWLCLTRRARSAHTALPDLYPSFKPPATSGAFVYLEAPVILDVILPAASFCQAVSWWLFCRVKPRRRNCWLPWNC